MKSLYMDVIYDIIFLVLDPWQKRGKMAFSSSIVTQDSIIATARDVKRKVDAFEEIDIIFFIPLLRGWVYLALNCSRNGDDYGGMSMEVERFEQLKRTLQGRVRFINKMDQ